MTDPSSFISHIYGVTTKSPLSKKRSGFVCTLHVTKDDVPSARTRRTAVRMVKSLLFHPPHLPPPKTSMSLLPIIKTVSPKDDDGGVPVELPWLGFVRIDLEAVVTFNVPFAHLLVLLLRSLPTEDTGINEKSGALSAETVP